MRLSFFRKVLICLLLFSAVPSLTLTVAISLLSASSARSALAERLASTVEDASDRLGSKLTAMESDVQGLARTAAELLGNQVPAEVSREAMRKYDRLRNGILCMDRYYSESLDDLERASVSNLWVTSPDPLDPAVINEIVATESLDHGFRMFARAHRLASSVALVTENSVVRYFPWSFTLDTDSAIECNGEPDPYYAAADPFHNPDLGSVWTLPYWSPDQEGWVITCSAPVVVTGRFRGVVAADLPLENLKAFLDPAASRGAATILNRSGEVIYHAGLLSERAAAFATWTHNLLAESLRGPGQDCVTRMTLGHQGTGTFIEGSPPREWILSHAPIAGLNWSLGIQVDVGESLAPMSRMPGLALRVGALVLAASILPAWFVARRGSRKVEEVTRKGSRLLSANPRFRTRRLPEDELTAIDNILAQLGVKMEKQKGMLVEQNLRLKATEDRYRALVDNVRNIIYTVDPQGHLSFANRQWDATLGYEIGTVLGSGFLTLIHPGDRSKWQDTFHRCMNEGEIVHDLLYRIADKDGSWRWHECEATAVRCPDPECSFFMGIADDITEKRLVEQHLLQAQKMESIGALAGGIAHDIGNLLTPILGFSQLIRDHVGNSDLILEFADVLDCNLTKLDGLTRQLLMFGRKSDVQYHPIDFKSTIEEGIKLLTPSLEEGVRLQVDLTPETCIIRGEHNQIQQSLMNLCLNAAQAMQHGGTLRIRLEKMIPDSRFLQSHPGSHPDPYVCLTVADSGIGMSEETQHKIFEPFFTTKARGKGTGLGLSMVLKIVEDHHGFIDVESELGSGTEFRVYLPEMTDKTPSSTEAQPAVNRNAR